MSWDEEYQVELDKGSKFLVNNTYSRPLFYRHLLQFYRHPILILTLSMAPTVSIFMEKKVLPRGHFNKSHESSTES